MHHGIAEFGVNGRRHVADGAVRPDGVVVIFPIGQCLPVMIERTEQGLVQQFVPQPPVEALDEGVLGVLLPGAM